VLLSGMCCEQWDWQAGTDHCRWSGITCRDEASGAGGGGPITQIALPRVTLVGDLSIASAWAKLPQLSFM
jgi:hypothetical protein